MVRRTGTRLYALVRLRTGILGWIALGNCLVFAQGSTAAISGVVHDATGGVVPGVGVTVKHTESGLTRTAQTNENGSFSMSSLPVGPYEVIAEKQGFKQQVRRGINLAVGQEAVVNLTLDVGNLIEQITVTEEAPLVNTTLSSTSGLITEQQIKDLPLNGRSFDQLLTLNVGTVDNRSNINNNAWTSFSVAGKRPETNRFLMNGVDYIGSNSTGQFITPSGSSGQLLGVEAVREYNVLQQPMARNMESELARRSAWCPPRGRTSGMEMRSSIYATALWTPGTSSTTPLAPRRSSGINLEEPWEVR